MSNKVYRSITLTPSTAAHQDGTSATLQEVNTLQAKAITTIYEILSWGIKVNVTDPEYYKAIKDGAHPETGEILSGNSHEIGRTLGYRYQEYLPPVMLVKSRVERIINHHQVALDKARGDKWKTYDQELYSSQGKKRTLSHINPQPGKAINLGAVNIQYASISVKDSIITLHVVAYSEKYILTFDLPEEYRGGEKVCLPIISLNEHGNVRYHFPVQYPRQLPEITTKYVIGIDVGEVHPFMITVIDTETKHIVATVPPSHRIYSLARDIRVTEEQIKNMQRKKHRYIINDPSRYQRLEQEIVIERLALARKRREIAILSGQEIVDTAIAWGNAVIAVEDLGWIVNTMENGRWNRGQVVRWVEHYCNLQGLLCYKVSAYNTSRGCHACGSSGYFAGREFRCSNVDCKLRLDRDVNAGANIAIRVISRAVKSAATRVKTRKKWRTTKKLLPVDRRVPARRERLSRDKAFPTGRRPRVNRKRRTLPSHLVRVGVIFPGSGSEGATGGTRVEPRSDCDGQPMVTLCQQDST